MLRFLTNMGGGRWLRSCLVCVLCLSASPSWSDSEAEQRARLKALRQSIETLRQELKNVKSDRAQLLQALEQAEKAIGRLSTQVEQLNRQLKQEERELNELRQQKDALENDKQAQQRRVGEHLAAAYRLGQQSSLRLLLNQQDPALVSRNLKYFDYITRARVAKISAYISTLNELARVEQRIAAQTAQLREDQQAIRRRQQALALQQDQRRSTLEQLNQVIAGKDEKLRQQERDRQDLERVLERVAGALGDVHVPADADDFAKLKGRLPWPIEGRIVERFGSERVQGRVRWQGMVIRAEAGTPVRAIHHGRVVFSDYLRGHGLLLIIDHGTGFMSLYAHNQALYKEIGEWVDSGEVVASVGASGGQTKAGLYFELRYKGQPTDPQEWIRTT